MSTLLTTYNDALRELTERKGISDERVVNCQVAIDHARTALQGSTEATSRAVFEENQARKDFVELLESLKAMPNGGPAILQERLTSFQRRLSEKCEASRQARLAELSKREALEKAEADFAYAKDSHAKIDRDWIQLAEQIQRLETPR